MNLASEKSLRELRRKLVNALNGQCSIYDIWIVLPITPTFEDETSRAIIQDPGGTPRSLREPFKVDQWLNTYWANKWTGYVFCSSGEELRKLVGKKAAELFADEFKFELKPEAFDHAKIR